MGFLLDSLSKPAVANERPQVRNVRAEQSADTTLVDIYYDLFDADGDTLVVNVTILDSMGTDTIWDARTFSGDLGPNVLSGQGKHIEWNIRRDLPDTLQHFVALVTASDGLSLSSSGIPVEIRVELPSGEVMEFVWIKPGSFMMGSPAYDNQALDEKPQHRVTISQGFWLAKYEITQGQWEAVMGTRPWSGGNYVQANADYPAVYISWEDVQDFIQELNEVAGEELYRLPTEAEWEYACRAGTTTRWFFGNDENLLGEYAWYKGNSWDVGEEYAHAVGTKKPNPWGLYDMYGNVMEWCQDWFGDYSDSAQTDPIGPTAGTEHVSRGGFLGFSAWGMRSASRHHGPLYTGARLLMIPTSLPLHNLNTGGETQVNTSPLADAGLDQTVEVGKTMQLDGSGSSDADGDVLSFVWEEDTGNPLTGILSDISSMHPKFTPEISGVYRFTLVVNDGQTESVPDEVMIVVIQGKTVELPGGATMELVWIEPGTFMMGSPDSESDRDSDEGPQHQVSITQGFYLGKYEITQEQWESVMGNNPSIISQGMNKPVEMISWYDVQEFIRRLNEAMGDSLYRLPTEAEWEYACRAGTKTTWSFGNDWSELEKYAWYYNNSKDSTKNVGMKIPNSWGLYDMYGNVWEWCQDWYGEYSSDSQTDPTGSLTGNHRVQRGGAYDGDFKDVRSARRKYSTHDWVWWDSGARLLRIK